MTEEWFSELEYKSIDNTQSEEQRKMIEKKKNQQRLSDLWDNMKRSKICIIGNVRLYHLGGEMKGGVQGLCPRALQYSGVPTEEITDKEGV